MKRLLSLFWLPAGLSTVVLILASCSSSSPQGEKNVSNAFREAVPGGTWAETYTGPATLENVDPAQRKVTLVTPDGSRETFTADASFQDFGKLRAGETLQATITRNLAVYLLKDGEPPSITALTAKEGSQPAALKTDTVQRNATVGAVDWRQGKVTLNFADGTSKNYSCRKDVDLRRTLLGDEVVYRTTSTAVFKFEKP